MPRSIGAMFTAVFVLCLAAGQASAQYPPSSYLNSPNYGVGFRPRLSPYLDLANGGNPAVNYYLGTLPEFERRGTQRLYGAAISDLAAARAPTAAGRRFGCGSLQSASHHRPRHGFRQYPQLLPGAAGPAAGGRAASGAALRSRFKTVVQAARLLFSQASRLHHGFETASKRRRNHFVHDHSFSEPRP